VVVLLRASVYNNLHLQVSGGMNGKITCCSAPWTLHSSIYSLRSYLLVTGQRFVVEKSALQTSVGIPTSKTSTFLPFVCDPLRLLL
jgi:hypothetical protein